MFYSPYGLSHFREISDNANEIHKIKFKRIFQRKTYFVWATEVIIGNPAYCQEPMRLLITQLTTAIRNIQKHSIYYLESQSKDDNFDKLILVLEKVNNKNKRPDHSTDTLDYFQFRVLRLFILSRILLT